MRQKMYHIEAQATTSFYPFLYEALIKEGPRAPAEQINQLSRRPGHGAPDAVEEQHPAASRKKNPPRPQNRSA